MSKKARIVAKVVQHLLSKCNDLSSNPILPQKEDISQKIYQNSQCTYEELFIGTSHQENSNQKPNDILCYLSKYDDYQNDNMC
jgi:hypothetical protein